MNSTEPHSPNLLCSLQPFMGTQRWLESSPYGPPAIVPSSDSPFFLPTCGLTQICFFLGGPFPWLDPVITGARKTWGWGPSFWSFFALTGWRRICSIFFFFKSTKTRSEKKRSSLGEKELLCSLQLPSLELVGGAVPREAEGEHQGGVQLVLSGPQECLWSGSRSWLQLLFRGSSVSQGLNCVPIWRACLGLLPYLCFCTCGCMSTSIYVCAGGSAVGRGCVRIHIYLYVSLSVCVCVCMCVRGSGRKGARR